LFEKLDTRVREEKLVLLLVPYLSAVAGSSPLVAVAVHEFIIFQAADALPPSFLDPSFSYM
jgi:hypothetical protein